MKKKITLFMFVLFVSLLGVNAQETVSCYDENGYVDSKNTIGGTGYYILTAEDEQAAAQTYHYSGPGNITAVTFEGQITGFLSFFIPVQLKVSIYNVDAFNRPTTEIDYTYTTWYNWMSEQTVFFEEGVFVDHNFAVAIEMYDPDYDTQDFQVVYTGDGEGAGEDLPSVAGPTTGGNWVSTLPAKDGDFYIYPTMQHFITADFEMSTQCATTSTNVSFMNYTDMTTDMMFNTIGLSGYSGGEVFYEWDFADGGTSTLENPSHTFTTPGAYIVELTTTIDGWNDVCSDTKTMKISVGLDVQATSLVHVDCYGEETGEVTASVTGGAPLFEYWIPGVAEQSNPDFSDLAAGTYTLYVEDDLGCEDNVSFTITQPTQIIIADPVGITGTTCGNSDGAILATATGGTGTLQYKLGGGSYQSTGAFDNLSAGLYTIYVKDANDCVVTKLVFVPSTDAPSLELLSYTNVSCKDGSDGTITVIGSGGTGTLQYSLDGQNWQGSGSFTGLSAGIYVPVVKDQATCEGSLCDFFEPTKTTNGNSCEVHLTEPTQIMFALTYEPTLCFGSSDGQVDVHDAIGGTGLLEYSINGVDFQSGTNFSGLVAGIKTVTVRDIAGCTATENVEVTQPDVIVVDASGTDLSCYHSGDGLISASATGGNGGYEFSLDDEDYFPSGEFYSLSAGTYTIYVTDANECTGSTTVTINEPAMITATITAGNSTCGNANGTILAAAAGGSGSGYLYSIDGGSTTNGTGSFSGLDASTYLVWIQDGDGCEKVFTKDVTDSDGPTIAGSTSTDVTCNGGATGTITITSVTGGTGTIQYGIDGSALQLSNIFTGLEAGDHVVVVEDANGCRGEVTINLTEPNAIIVTLTGVDITCFEGNDGEITVSAAGGSGTLAYRLNDNAFQGPDVFENLIAGEYTITVRDAGGCTASDDIILTEPTEIEMTYGVLEVACYGDDDGAINVSATGGTGTLEFSLDDISYQSSGTFSNLVADEYTLYVRDASGCVVYEELTITEPDVLILNSNISNVSCNGGDDGVIDLMVMGGVATFTYVWSNAKTTEDIFNLKAGNYSITVTDDNGCKENDTYTVTEPASPLIVNGVTTDASSGTAADGAIDVTATGGTIPYAYNWSNGAFTEDLTAITSGVYFVEVIDVNDCIASAEFGVSDPTNMFAVLGEVTDVNCAGGSDGTIDITASGGTEPYIYEWSNGATKADISNLAADTYDVTITDDDSYKVYGTYTVVELSTAITVTGTATNAASQTAEDGVVDITVAGGTTPYTYSWSNNETTEDIDELAPAVYTVIVEDANGCLKISGFTVSFNVGVNDIEDDNYVNIYPNPANSVLNVELGAANGLVKNVTLIDITGKVVYEVIPEGNNHEIDIKSFAEGMYFVKISTENRTINRMIVIGR